MAKIPALTDSPRVRQADPLQPTLTPGQAAAPFKETAKFAESVAGSLSQLRQKQQKEADKVSYTKANIGLSQSFNNISSEMEEEYRSTKPNYEGYAQDGVARLEARRDEILESSPDSAKAQISLAFDQKMARMGERFNSTESARKSEYARIETDGMISDASTKAYQSSSPLEAMEDMGRLKGLVISSSKYDEKGKKVLLGRIEDIPKDLVNGVLDREDPAEMRQTLNDLNSEAMGPVFGSMDPRIITKAKSRLEKKIAYKNNEGLKETRGKYKDSISALQNKTLNPLNPRDKKILSNVKNEIETRMGEEGRAFIDNIEAYEKASEISTENAFSITQFDPESESLEISSDIKDPLKRAGSRGKVKQILNSQKASMQNDLAKDPASYLMKHDSAIALQVNEIVGSNDPLVFKEYMNSMDSRYDELGTPGHQRKYVPAPLKEHYGGAINRFIDSGDFKSASAMMNELSAKSGDDFFKFYDELGIPDKYAGVPEILDPDARTRTMKNLMNEEEVINPRYLGHAKKKRDVDIKSDLRKSSFYQSIIGEDAKSSPTSGRRAESLLSAAQVAYKLAILNDSTKAEAETKAWEDLSAGYEMVDNGEFPIAVNIKKHGNGIKTKLYIDNNTKADIDYVNKYNLDLGGGSMDARNAQFKRGSAWTYNRKSDSLRLVVHENGSWKEARDINDKAVTVSLSDIDRMEGMTKKDDRLVSRREILSRPSKKKSLKFKVENFF